MAILAGGAMRIVDPKKKSATMADDCIGFLDLIWGAHAPSRAGDGALAFANFNDPTTTACLIGAASSRAEMTNQINFEIRISNIETISKLP